MAYTFKIFKPISKFYLTPNLKLLLLVLVAVALIPSDFNTIAELKFLGYLAVLFTFILSGYYKLTQHWSKPPLHGDFEGELILEHSIIRLNDEQYPLEMLTKISIENKDYEYAYCWPTTLDFNPARSHGVNNFFVLHHKNGSIKKVQFIQKTEHELVKAREYLIHYHLMGKLSFLNLLDILNITDYTAIQDFKKTLILYHR